MRIALAFERYPCCALHAILRTIRPARDRTVSIQVHTGHLKTQTTVDLAVDIPGDVRHFVIRIGVSSGNLSHGSSSCGGAAYDDTVRNSRQSRYTAR